MFALFRRFILTSSLHTLLTLGALMLALPFAAAADRVFYAGGIGVQQFHDTLELADGTLLVGGAADSLAWLPPGTPLTPLSPTAANGSSIHQQGVASGRTAFLLHLTADGGQVLRCLHFPHGAVDEVRWIKTTTVPGSTTAGPLFISGTRGSTTNHTTNGGGFFIARLDQNLIDAVPTGLHFVYNLPTSGKTNAHAIIQPWDVLNDGRVVAQSGGAYRDNWGEIVVLPANPGPAAPASMVLPPTPMPGFRFHNITDGSATRGHYGTADTIPAGFSIVGSQMITKTQRTNSSGLQRSFTVADFHHWQRDENGYWRKGRYPLDAFWNNYWRFPETISSSNPVNNMWSGDATGYTGYKLTGTGGTEGSPYTPRVGAIIVDRRNNYIYLGLNWQTRLPSSNNPDFEPALIALDEQGYYKWWARLYQEYNDTSTSGPQNIVATVTEVLSATQIRVAATVGLTLNLDRKTSGSDGFINGYRRLHWTAGASHAHTLSRLVTHDSATGTFTLLDPLPGIQPGDPLLIDGTEMTRTHTSTPDQYIDALAIDYSTPLDPDQHAGILYVAARSHGNNVVNFWRGNQVAANPGGQGFVNSFTGSNGNIHLGWLGKLRDHGDRATLLAATFVAEYTAANPFGDNNSLGDTDSDPRLDFWPNQNGGWPNRNTTNIGPRMAVNTRGEVVLHGYGRTVQTTANAYQRNLRPSIGARVTSAASASQITSASLVGARLFLQNCRLRLNNQVRVVTGFDNATGTLTLATPLPSVPAPGTSFRLDEGIGNWGNFVRVYASDLSTLTYSTLLSSAINPIDGVGTGANSELFGITPLRDGRLLVSGYHANGTGNVIPTANLPAWGRATPDGSTALLAFFDTRDYTPPPAPTTFAAWRIAYFNTAQLADPLTSAATATPLGDGLPNLLKYHLGLAPWTPVPPSARPTAELVSPGTPPALSLSYWKSRYATDTTGIVEWSTTLAPDSWSTQGITTGTIGQTDTHEHIQAQVSVAAHPRLFMRLRVATTP